MVPPCLETVGTWSVPPKVEVLRKEIQLRPRVQAHSPHTHGAKHHHADTEQTELFLPAEQDGNTDEIRQLSRCLKPV